MFVGLNPCESIYIYNHLVIKCFEMQNCFNSIIGEIKLFLKALNLHGCIDDKTVYNLTGEILLVSEIS